MSTKKTKIKADRSSGKPGSGITTGHKENERTYKHNSYKEEKIIDQPEKGVEQKKHRGRFIHQTKRGAYYVSAGSALK